MNRLKKLLIIMAVTVIAIIGAGCGGNLNTEFTLDESLSGKRVMTFVCNKSDNSSYITGDYAEISATVAANTPDVLTFADVSTDTDISYTFTLEFKDLNDYLTKVNSLLSVSETTISDELISYELSDSIFEAGINYRENFTSAHLMAWFPRLLVDSGYVAESRINDILSENSTTHVVFGYEGTDYGYMVNVESLRKLQLGEISILTAFNPDETVDRTVSVKVPEELMSANEAGIKAFLENSVPENAEKAWKEKDRYDYYTYEVTQTSMTAEDVAAFMTAFCGEGKTCSFQLEPGEKAWPELKPQLAPLHVWYSVVESYDLSRFNDAYDGEPSVAYELKADAAYSGVVKYAESEKKFEYYSSYYDNEAVYTRGSNATYTYSCTRIFDLSAAAIELNCKSDGKVERTVTLIADVEPSDKLKENVLFAAEKVASSVQKEDGTMTVSAPSDKNSKSFTLVITTKADADKEAKIWKDTYNLDNKLTITETGGALAFKKDIEIEDNFELGLFSNTDIANVTYVLSGYGKFKDERLSPYASNTG